MVNFNVCMVTRYFSAKARIIDKYTHAFEFIHRTLQFSNVIYMLHLSEQRPHSRSLTVARSICSRSLSHVRSALARSPLTLFHSLACSHFDVYRSLALRFALHSNSAQYPRHALSLPHYAYSCTVVYSHRC